MKNYLTLALVFFGILHAEKAYVLGYGTISSHSIIYILDTERALITGSVAGVPVNSDYLGDIAFSPNGKIAYVVDQTGLVYVIDVESDTYIGNVIGGSFGFTTAVAFSPDGKKAYVTNRGGGASTNISIVDVATNTVTGVVSHGSQPPFGSPYGVAFSLDGSFAYVSDEGEANNCVYVIDTATDTAISLVTGASPGFDGPTWITFSPDGTYAYVSNESGSAKGVYRIETATHTVSTKLSEAGGIPELSNPQLVAFLPDGTRAYIPDSNSSPQTVFIADTATSTITGIVASTYGNYNGPTQIGITYNGLYGFVANEGGGPLYIIGVESGIIVGTASIAFGVDPISDAQAIALKPKPLPPAYASASSFNNNFGLLYELCNTLSWGASNSVVTEYRIYRNGTLIGRVNASTLQYNDHDAPKGVSSYSITAVDASGVEGTAVSISVNTF